MVKQMLMDYPSGSLLPLENKKLLCRLYQYLFISAIFMSLSQDKAPCVPVSLQLHAYPSRHESF